VRGSVTISVVVVDDDGGTVVTAGVVVVVIVVGAAVTTGATVVEVVVVALGEQAPATSERAMMNETRRRSDLLPLQMVSARWLSSLSVAAT
jgi:hypothetical protein